MVLGPSEASENSEPEPSSPPVQPESKTPGVLLSKNLEVAVIALIGDCMRQRRAKRLWRFFFRTLGLGLLAFAFWQSDWRQDAESVASKPHTAVIDVQGVIAAEQLTNADTVTKALRKAFANPQAKGLILKINSPGGTPVQANTIYQAIRQLKQSRPSMPVIAVCIDLCASGAYYLAAAADQIYADPSSLVGSIGVLYEGFGFSGALEKLGVERRLMTSGEYKGLLDPFSPVHASHKQKVAQMLLAINQEFVQAVIQGRGDRLKKNDPELFSGLAWVGVQAKALGLIDGFGSPEHVARECIKEVRTVDYTEYPRPFEKFVRQFGLSMKESILALSDLTDLSRFR